MAVAVDSFSYLLNETIAVFSRARDVLAVLGAAYAIYKTTNGIVEFAKVGRTHLVSSVLKQDLAKRYGKWALVTGCTSGIGEAFVRELAQRGLNIILVSRDSTKLESLAQDLRKSYGVETCCIVADFVQGRSSYGKLEESIRDKEIGVLVNNAGVMYDYPEEFLAVSREKLWELIYVNMASATIVMHAVLPQMVARGRGAVITMSSSAAFLPAPLITVYSATKAYLDYVMTGIRQEYGSKGIVFQTLIPFYIATRMTKYSSILSSANIFVPDSKRYVHSALCTLGWSDRTTGYFPHTILLWFARLIPTWLWMKGGLIMNQHFRKHAAKSQ